MPPYLRIKFERHRNGWLQSDVAKHPEVRKARPRLTQNDISDIELGRRIPTADQLEALGRAFRVWPPAVLMKPVSVRDPEEVEQVTA